MGRSSGRRSASSSGALREVEPDRALVRTTQPRISVVVPALNEAANLREVLPELPDVHEVIVVDGGSVDDSLAVARATRPDIIGLTQVRRGKGNALAAGFAHVTGDIVVMFDADGSADPSEIERFVGALLGGADYAKGSRFLEGGGSDDLTLLRRVGNRFLSNAMNRAFGTRFTDLCYGYNAFWADLLPVLDLPDPDAAAPVGVRPGAMAWGDGFEIETLITCRFAAARVNVTEVPSVERPRRWGSSNLHAFSDGRRVLHTLRAEQALRRAQRRRSADRAGQSDAASDAASGPTSGQDPRSSEDVTPTLAS